MFRRTPFDKEPKLSYINNKRDMAEQTRLEQEAVALRKEMLVRNEYQRENNEYSAEHPDAKADGKPLGKGTGSSVKFIRPDKSKPKTQMAYTVDTESEAGGLYDIEGRNGVGGRKRGMIFNLYSKDRPYSRESIDTSANVKEGQYTIR